MRNKRAVLLTHTGQKQLAKRFSLKFVPSGALISDNLDEIRLEKGAGLRSIEKSKMPITRMETAGKLNPSFQSSTL